MATHAFDSAHVSALDPAPCAPATGAPARFVAWHAARRFHVRRVPPRLRRWLLAEGSLTAHVRARCTAGFVLRVLRERRVRPRPDEARALGVPADRLVLLREVALCDGDRPLVIGRTLIPLRTLRGSGARFAALGRRPLGAVLFHHRAARRGPLAIACVDPRQAGVLAPPCTPGRLWARRAVFRVGGAPLLVSEFFLPGLF